ncbi:MAG: SgcJ/EcaC family oxidoreductase [Calothrix sp. C42_A2020_038]|nr:SgcJ/EcaC family oxidoreductase [Calothrix sp. C42_A2020_038]
MTSFSVLCVRDEIIAVNQKLMKAFELGDIAGVASLYTENGQLLPPNGDFIISRKAIENFWQGIFAANITNITLNTIECESHGDTAIEIGRYTLSNRDTGIVDSGKYIVIWKKEDEWRLNREIWNSSQSN